MLRLAVLASGAGSNFQALADAVKSGALHAEIVATICNVPGAAVIARSEAAGVPVFVLPSKGMTTPEAREQFDHQVAEKLVEVGAELLVLAGYMRLLSPQFIHRFANRIVNIHPSLLPAFPGLNVHQSVLDYGCKVSGCTVHFVDEGLDSGPIIAQCTVPVLEDDTAVTLADRIHGVEHQVYPWAIELIARNHIRLDGRRVVIDASAGLPPQYLP